MDEKNLEDESAAESADEQALRRLLERAGPRPEVPQEDLEAISSTLRSAWQVQVRRHAAPSPRRIESQRRAPARRPAWPRRSAWPGVAALAAVLAIAAGLAWWWVSQGDRLPPLAPVAVARVEAVTGALYLDTERGGRRALALGEPIPPGAGLTTGSGNEPGRASLALTGGATLRLDVGTHLHLTSASEVALEEGALYADTGDDRGAAGGAEKRPGSAPSAGLVVWTPLGTARDVGTRFALRLDGMRGTLNVRVRDGAVEVERSGSTFLTPTGQELVLRRDGTAEQRMLSPYGPEWEWVIEAAAGFEVEGRNLEEFLAWVSRETGWQVRYEEGALTSPASGIVLHGAIGNLRPDQAPFAVLPGAGLEGELAGDTLIVRRLER